MSRSNDVDELRRFIRQNPSSIYVPEARNRIELLEYKIALKTNTRYAYNLFLQRHPGSVHVVEINRRLEDLDYDLIKQHRSLSLATTYLTTWPKGRHAEAVRALHDEILCQDWQKSQDPLGLGEFLRSHPDISCRGVLESRWQELLFQRAMSSDDARLLVEYLHTFPKGKRSTEAKTRLAQLRVEAFLRAARFDKAMNVIQLEAGSSDVPGLTSKVEAARISWLRSSFDPGHIRKLATAFGPEEARSLRQWAARLGRRQKYIRSLAEATAILRRPLVDHNIGDSTLTDPRARWLDAKNLSMSPDEETAKFLLDLQSDSFLEVRRQALVSLRTVTSSLGKVRAEAWISMEEVVLRPRAQSGLLLLKLGILHDLAGNPDEAFGHIEKLQLSAEESDLFALYLAADLARRSGKDNLSATLARKFSIVAREYSDQRIKSWSSPGGLKESPSGWLSLRQLFGVMNLWNEILVPFLPDTAGQVQISPAENLLGAWLERARSDLGRLSTWFSEQEREWGSDHPEYRSCSSQPSSDAAGAAETDAADLEKKAIFLLALSGFKEAATTLEFVTCCHPRSESRETARVVTSLIDLSRVLGRCQANLEKTCTNLLCMRRCSCG